MLVNTFLPEGKKIPIVEDKKAKAEAEAEAKAEAEAIAKDEVEEVKEVNAGVGKNFFEKAIGALEKRIGDLENLIRGLFDKEAEDREDKDYNFKERTQPEILKFINYAKNNDINNGKENRRCYCGNECSNYANSIVAATNIHEIADPLLLLSIMMQESNCEFDASGDNEKAVGLMQIHKTTFDGICKDKIKDVNSFGDIKGENTDKNIECGALILKKKYTDKVTFEKSGEGTTSCERDRDTIYYGWEAALRGYNGLGCSGENGNDNYVEEVMKIYEGLKGIMITDTKQN